MVLIPTPDIYGYTTFCDDIREEVGGKHSFIGSYAGLMIIHVPFPVALPTFALAVTIMQKRKVFDPNLRLWVFLPGDSESEPSIQGKFTEVLQGKVVDAASSQLETLHPATQDSAILPEDRYVALSAHMRFSQLILKEPGAVKARAVIGDNIYRLGVLLVSPPPIPPQITGPSASVSPPLS